MQRYSHNDLGSCSGNEFPCLPLFDVTTRIFEYLSPV